MARPEIEELVRKGDVEALRGLADSEDKATAKAARRGLHQLRSRGNKAAVPPAPRAAPPLARPAAEAAACYATTADRDGSRLLCLVRVGATGGLELYEAHVQEGRGIVSFGGGEMARKQVRELVDEVRGMVTVAEVPWSYVRSCLEEAYRENLATGRAAPADFLRARSGLGKADPMPLHPALERWPQPPSVQPEAIVRLHETPECSTWAPDLETLQRTALALEEIEQSRLVLSPVQKRAAVADVLDKAVRTHFSDATRRERLRRRLLDVAYLLAQDTDKVQTAEAARAAADEFGAEGLVPAEGRFARRYFEKCFGTFLAPEPKEGEKPSEAGTLIVP